MNTQTFKNYLLERGTTDLSALSDLFELCRTTGDHDTTKKIRVMAAGAMLGTGNAAAEEIYRKTLMFDGAVNFDCFMRYMEIDRPQGEQFWLPRRKKLMNVCQALQDMEDGELDELFLSMPPRVGKSTLVSMFTLWAVLRNSERSNLYVSYSDTVAKTFYRGLLEILQDSVTYKWHDVFPSSQLVMTDAKDMRFNIDRNKRYASFTGRSLYGTLNGACDCNGYAIADDLHSGIDEAMSKDRLEGAWMRVDNNYLPRAKESAKRIWIGTRWSLMDAQARRVDLLTNDPRFRSIRWQSINVPALDENDKSNFEFDYGVGFSSEYYHQRRASFEKNNDMASWLAQYQGEPIERDGSVFNPADMRYFNGVLPEATPDRIFMAVDPAWGGGDFTAAPVCYQFGDDIYIADVVYDDGDKRITQPQIVDAIRKHNVQAVTVEATRTTASYTEDLDRILKDRGIKINIRSSISHYTGTGKQQRIFDKAPEIRERMIFLSEANRSRAYIQFMANVYAFTVTGRTKHDDAPDSLAMAINMAFLSVQKVEVVRRMF